MKREIILVVVLLLSIQLVFALGIRPAKTQLFVEQSRELTGEFWVVNNDLREMEARVYVEGEMAQFITLQDEKLTFRADQEAQPVRFELAIPVQEAIPPGDSIANIMVEEVIDATLGGVSSKVTGKPNFIFEQLLQV